MKKFGKILKVGLLKSLVLPSIWGVVLAGALPVQARTADRPFFRASAIVIVIGATEDQANGGIASVAADFVFLDTAPGTASADIINADGFVMNSKSGWNAGFNFAGGASRLDLKNQTSGGSFSNGGNTNYLDTGDSYTAFGLDTMTDITTKKHRKVSRFLVVSNAPFDLYAEASNLAKIGDFSTLDFENIGIKIRLNTSGGSGLGAWGTRASYANLELL